jgi:hypothetical protein
MVDGFLANLIKAAGLGLVVAFIAWLGDSLFANAITTFLGCPYPAWMSLGFSVFAVFALIGVIKAFIAGAKS